MLAKAPHIEKAAEINQDLLANMIELITLCVESYNGLSSFIDQCSNDATEMSVINEKLKTVNQRLLGVQQVGK
ncbi:MAG: hypothetical protein QM500_02850 [Methylococcales bacterium]